ncbi:hypothetical protein [Marinicellulosiphila megalodicopiae]|uniref:hypothetical protein n=1 Tax=Marinicellulosiphila megalodicopiae TaxID=2724896 RepID=UPI003BAF3ED8
MFLRITTCLLLIFMIASCSKFNVIKDIKINVSTKTTIEGGGGFLTILDTFGFSQFNQFDLSTSQKFKDDIGDVSRVERANLETFVLSVTDETQSLDFINSVQFYISIDGDSEVLLAWSDNFALDSTSVSLDVDKTIDLTPYIKSKNIKIRSEVSGGFPDDDTEIQADLLFLIDAKIIK